MNTMILFGNMGTTNRTLYKHLTLLLVLASFATFFAGGCSEPSQSNYTITFNTDDGSAVESQSIASGGKATKPSNPTKDGFTFVDWYKDVSKTTVFDFNSVITASVTIYAKWNQNAANQFTVTFNVDGGSSIPDQVVTSGGKATRPSTNPTKAGLTFVDWYKEPAKTTVFNFATETIIANTTLYAKWTITYTVTFNTDGGSAVESQSIVSGNKATKPTNPTKAGFTFVDWYKEPAKTTVFDFNSVITASMTLYAKWTAITYTVTFDLDGGTGNASTANQTIASGGKATKPTNPTKVGFTFADWYKEPAKTTVFDFNTTITASMTLYAKWTIAYTVTFDLDGGTGNTSTANQTVASGNKATKPTNPTRTGYVFDDWYKDAEKTTVFDFNTTITASMTLYAKWTITYTVTFNVDGGSAITDQIITDGEKAIRPSNPTRTGYVFDDWYKEPAKTTVFDFNSVITASMTLYAKWTIAYTVTFDLDGGTGNASTANQTIASGGKATKPTNPTKAGYTLDNWYKEPAKTTVFDFNSVITASVTLYAKWNLVFTQAKAKASAEFSVRSGHTSVVFNNKLWVIGGSDGYNKNDVWSTPDGVTWTQTTTSGTIFSARNSHTTVVFNNKLWVIGGRDGFTSSTNDIWSTPDGVTWTQETTSGTIFSARESHTSVVFNNKLWVIGGYDGSSKNDVWSTPDGATWTQVTTSNTIFSARDGHTSVVFNNKLWVIGGADGSRKNDVWSTPDGVTWTQTTTSGTIFSARFAHTTVVFNNKLWVIGGSDGSSRKNDVWSTPDGVTWKEETASAAFTARLDHTSVVFSNKLWVIGGNDGSQKNDVWRTELSQP